VWLEPKKFKRHRAQGRVSAPGRKRLGRSPSRSKGQSPTATSRENKIEDQEPPIATLATTTKDTCGKGERSY
jgi:hypothetical protein